MTAKRKRQIKPIKRERIHQPYVMVEGYAKLAGYDLDALAAELGVNRRTLDHKINGWSDFTLTESKLTCRLIGQRAEDIFLEVSVAPVTQTA